MHTKMVITKRQTVTNLGKYLQPRNYIPGNIHKRNEDIYIKTSKWIVSGILLIIAKSRTIQISINWWIDKMW